MKRELDASARTFKQNIYADQCHSKERRLISYPSSSATLFSVPLFEAFFIYSQTLACINLMNTHVDFIPFLKVSLAEFKQVDGISFRNPLASSVVLP
jgi:hypothetical protein